MTKDDDPTGKAVTAVAAWARLLRGDPAESVAAAQAIRGLDTAGMDHQLFEELIVTDSEVEGRRAEKKVAMAAFIARARPGMAIGAAIEDFSERSPPSSCWSRVTNRDPADHVDAR